MCRFFLAAGCLCVVSKESNRDERQVSFFRRTVMDFPLLVFPFILLLVKEAFVGLTGLLLIQKSGTVYGAEWHGKAATCLIYAMLLVHLFWVNIPPAIMVASVCLASGAILASFVLYAIRNLKLLKDRGR